MNSREVLSFTKKEGIRALLETKFYKNLEKINKDEYNINGQKVMVSHLPTGGESTSFCYCYEDDVRVSLHWMPRVLNLGKECECKSNL